MTISKRRDCKIRGLVISKRLFVNIVSVLKAIVFVNRYGSRRGLTSSKGMILLLNRKRNFTIGNQVDTTILVNPQSQFYDLSWSWCRLFVCEGGLVCCDHLSGKFHYKKIAETHPYHSPHSLVRFNVLAPWYIQSINSRRRVAIDHSLRRWKVS
jgi:hypothetical protein